MRQLFAPPVQELIDELGRLPGIGPKSAQRITYHLLKRSREDALRLARSIAAVKEKISFCRTCFNIAEVAASADGENRSDASEPGAESEVLCAICRDPGREASLVCVVEEPKDITSVERTQEYRGRYHVLQGAINHLEGVGEDQLRIKELLIRLQTEPISEVILCTNPNLEGEYTALYLARKLAGVSSAVPFTVSRIASGLPVGGDLEYADELTLGRALIGRNALL